MQTCHITRTHASTSELATSSWSVLSLGVVTDSREHQKETQGMRSPQQQLLTVHLPVRSAGRFACQLASEISSDPDARRCMTPHSIVQSVLRPMSVMTSIQGRGQT